MRSLARRHGISINPVQRAVLELSSRGILIAARQGYRVADDAARRISELGLLAETNRSPRAARGDVALLFSGAPQFDSPAMHWLYMPILNALQVTLAAARYRSLLCTLTDDNADRQRDYLRAVGQPLDGLVMNTGAWRERLVRPLTALGAPLVWIGILPTWAEKLNQRQFLVHSEDERGAAEGVRYLADLGHRRIGLIGREAASSPSEIERVRGFRGSIAERGLDTPPELERILRISHPYSHIEAYRRQAAEAMTTLLDLRDPPTAVFCTTDMSAFGALDAIRGRGLIPGLDISILGFDNLEDEGFLPFGAPTLTTLRMPRREMGEAAAQAIIDQWRTAGERGVERIGLQPELIQRHTCGRRAGLRKKRRGAA